MRYPGPDEDSESNSLWDIPIEDGIEDQDQVYYDSTLSEYSEYSPPEQQIQHPARPTTPEPRPETSAGTLQFGSIAASSLTGGSGSVQGQSGSRRERTDNRSPRSHRPPDFHSYHRHSSSTHQHFVPMVSINVPSRQNQRLSRFRRNSARYGSNGSLNRQNMMEDMRVLPYRNRPVSPSRIPMPIRHNTTFGHSTDNVLVGFNDGDEENTSGEAFEGPISDHINLNNEYLLQQQFFDPSLINGVVSPHNLNYLSQSNPAVARFIQPRINSTNNTLTDSSTQTEPAQILPDMTASEQTFNNLEEVPEAHRVSSDDELAFDNFIQLTDPPFRNNFNTLPPTLPSSASTNTHDQPNLTQSTSNSDKEHSCCESVENSSCTTSTQSTSGLSMKSRHVIPENPANANSFDPSDDEDEDSDTSTTQQEDEIKVSQPPDLPGSLRLSTNDDGEVAGPSASENVAVSETAAVSADLVAELVLDDSTVSKNGTCRLVFSDIHVNDLANLLAHNVSIALKGGKVIVLKIDQANPKDANDENQPKPIRRSISRYLGGKVLRSDSSKKVSFSHNLVRERKLSDSLTSTSSAGPAFGWSGEKDEEDDLLSGFEDFEED